jgi:hypothetical protein
MGQAPRFDGVTGFGGEIAAPVFAKIAARAGSLRPSRSIPV